MTKKQKTILAVILIVLFALGALTYILTVNSASYQIGQLLGKWGTAGESGSRELELMLYKDDLGTATLNGVFYQITWTINKGDYTMRFLNDAGAEIGVYEGTYDDGVLTVDMGGRTLTLTHVD